MQPVLCVGSRVLITTTHAVKWDTSNGTDTLEVNLNGRTGSISAIDDDRKTERVDVDYELLADGWTHAKLAAGPHMDSGAFTDIDIESMHLIALADEPNEASGDDGSVYIGFLDSGFYVGVVPKLPNKPLCPVEERYAHSSTALPLLLEGRKQIRHVIISNSQSVQA